MTAVTETLKYVDETTQNIFSRIRGVALTALLLFLAAPQTFVSAIASLGAWTSAAAQALIDFFHFGQYEYAFAIVELCIIWVGIQFVLFAHDTLLGALQAVLPSSSLIITLQVDPFAGRSRNLQNLAFKFFSKQMGRLEFEQVFDVYRDRALQSEDIRKRRSELTFPGVLWLRERLLLALVIFFAAGEHGHAPLFLFVVLVLSVWSVFNMSKQVYAWQTLKYEASHLAAYELINGRMDQKLDAKTDDTCEFDGFKRQLYIWLAIGPVGLNYTQPMLVLVAGPWTFGPIKMGPKPRPEPPWRKF